MRKLLVTMTFILMILPIALETAIASAGANRFDLHQVHTAERPQDEINLQVISALNLSPPNPSAGQIVEASFSVRNLGNGPVTLNRIGAGARGPGCVDFTCADYQDFPFDSQMTIGPGERYDFRAQRVFEQVGPHFAQIVYEAPAGAWHFLGDRVDFTAQPGLRLTESLSLSPINPTARDLVFTTFTMQNAGAEPLSFQRLVAAVRGPDCPHLDFGCDRIVDFTLLDKTTLAPGASIEYASQRLFPLPGDYFAQVSIQDELGIWRLLGDPIDFTVSPAAYSPRTSEWQLGVHWHPTWRETEDDHQLALAAAAGIKVVRIGASWRLMELNGKEQWDTDWYIPALGRVIDEANGLGMDVYLLLLSVPCWASSDPDKDCTDNGRWDDAFPPADYTDYADAFRQLVRLYGDRVQVYEVWNEPNVTRFWKPEPDADAYTALLVEAHQAIKETDSQAVVLGGSLAGSDIDFLDQMYAAGAKNHFDALALHPYSAGDPTICPDMRWAYTCGIDAVRSLMLHYGDDKDIWLTEFGWNTYGGERGVSEAAQQAYLISALDELAVRDEVKVATWYTLMDTTFDDPAMLWEDYFGLFHQDHTPKPAATWLMGRALPERVYLPLVERE